MIKYIDRKTNEVREEKVYGGAALKLLYGEGFFSRILSPILLPILAHLPLWSKFYGYLQKRGASRAKIKPFIEYYGIDASEFQTQNFDSFNDFFIRKLKPLCRPLASAPLTMPADGRYLAYQQFDRFFVKGQEFSLGEFLCDEELAKRYEKGAMVIARLCPIDYHRFHFPCDGVAGQARLINGWLYSVNPIALKKNVRILSQNKRVITEIDSEMGKVLFVEIGATSVGTIRQTYQVGRVMKGEEKGYFEFGGSCVVLLFEPGKVMLARDLVENTKKGFETLCRVGESLM